MHDLGKMLSMQPELEKGKVTERFNPNAGILTYKIWNL